MHIDITDQTTITEIQKVFSDFYPFLKLEFYKLPPKKYGAGPSEYLIDHESRICDIKHTHTSGLLEILPSSRAGDLEKEFFQRFGLAVEVFTRDRACWKQTTGMDDFTLKDLNEIGRNSSDEFIVSDYEEGFGED